MKSFLYTYVIRQRIATVRCAHPSFKLINMETGGCAPLTPPAYRIFAASILMMYRESRGKSQFGKKSAKVLQPLVQNCNYRWHCEIYVCCFLVYGTLPHPATRPLKTHSMAVRAIPLPVCHHRPPNGYRTGFKRCSDAQ